MAAASTPWVYLTDNETGYSYYANTQTGETSWEAPGELGGPDAMPYAKLDNGWFQYVDDVSGRPYYYNLNTQQTEWVAPPEAGVAGRKTRGESILEDDYISDDDSMPPPLPAGATSMANNDDDEDIDGAEDDVIVRRLSEADKAAPEPEVDAEAEAAAKAAKEQAKKEKRAKERLFNLQEFVSSERVYVNALHCLEKVYLDPMRMVADQPKGAIFSHKDLDAVFQNIAVISKVNTKFLEALEAVENTWPLGEKKNPVDGSMVECRIPQEDSSLAQVILDATKKFKGCYTRYVNGYDGAEAHLNKLKATDKDKQRYLDVCKSHPDAGNKVVRDFLIQPIQRSMRYPMLLSDMLGNTEPGHPDEELLKAALDQVKEVASHINFEKKQDEELNKLKEMVDRFAPDSGMDKELVRLDRHFLREGALIKARLKHQQTRYIFLFNDLMVYCVKGAKGYQVKGKIVLDVHARVEKLPTTEKMSNAFAVIEKGGKGYTWLAESAAEMNEWFDAVDGAIKSNKKQRDTTTGSSMLSMVASKPLEARLQAVQAGATFMKYNQRDGKSGARWVKLTADNKICWGDAKSKECKSSMKLEDAIALLHGAKSSAFFKQQHAKKDQDWLCFSVVFKGRGTLDFAATNADALIDWYLVLASKIPDSNEPLLDEKQLRERIEEMI